VKGTDMKDTKLSLIPSCTALIIIVASLLTTATAQTSADQKPGDWMAVEDVFGFPPANLPGGVARFNMPRDLHVTVGGTEVKPGLALGGWAAFHRIGDNDAMIMGDLVLTEDEVAPVMKALEDGGVEVTALHNHLNSESPKIMYLHMGGHGDPVKLAQTIKQAVGLTKTPIPRGAPAKENVADLGLDIEALDKIMGRQGSVSGGVLHYNVPRAEKLTEEGMETPPSMGAGTAINFQPTGSGRAAIAGDFAMTGKEVGPVMKVLEDNGVQVVALHSHALDDEPRLFYMHFWANDDAVKLAKTLRSAVDATNSAK
jgi:hypothetical protein